MYRQHLFAWFRVALLSFALILSCCNNNTATSVDPDLTAEEILSAMAANYAGFETYFDRGVVTSTISAEQIFSTEQRFTTAFERPDKFRFEYVNSKNIGNRPPFLAGIVWQNGEELGRYFAPQPTARSLTSLNLGIAEALGVSNTASHTVPALLMPNSISGIRLSDLANPVRESDANLGDRYSFVISGRHASTDILVWIDASEFLILKVQRHLSLRNGIESLSIIEYEPQINQPLNPNLLEFNAPPLPSGPL